MYRKMLLIRKFEEKVEEIYRQGRIPGIAHSYIGQEAVAVGVCSALREDDYVLGTHRGHGHSIAKGIHPKYLMAELMGKENGVCKGIGGSMHSTDPEKGVMFSTAIVGGNMPIAAGVALAIRLRKEDKVVVSFFGDGATNTGAFHEALNLASLWKLPAIFVCENNLYAISIHVSRSTSARNIIDRAVAYNMPGRSVDGNDVLAVYETALESVQRARKGEGPSLLECRTYRLMDHGMNYMGEYRSKDEIEEWRKRCPVKSFEKKLPELAVSVDDMEKVQKDVNEEIEESVRFAEESDCPSFEFVSRFVYHR